MKKISLILMLLCFSIITHAQVKKGNLSVKTVEYGTWIEESTNVKGHWDMDGPPTPWISLFKVTKNVITQTTEDEVYTYFIESSYYNKGEDRLEAEIVDENGTGYFMILDHKNSNIRFLYNDGEDNLRVTRFVFKSTWVEI